MTFVLYQITEDALLRQMEVIDQHNSRTSPNSWGHKWAWRKLQYLWSYQEAVASTSTVTHWINIITAVDHCSRGATVKHTIKHVIRLKRSDAL